MTIEEYVAGLYAGLACDACGTPLSPDEPCTGCGKIPPVTGPQLRAELARYPLTVAEAEAEQAIADGQSMVDAGVERIHEADRIRLVARLELARDQAQAALRSRRQAHQKLVADPELPGLREAAVQADRELETARAGHARVEREAQEASAYNRGFDAETEADLKLDKATGVLRKYERRAAKAQADLAPKLRLISDSGTLEKKLAADLAKARDALDHPGRIPYGGEAISAAPVRLILAGNLDDAEKYVAAAVMARWLANETGVTASVVADARREMAAEQEAAAKGKDLHLWGRRDGVTAVANPHNPNVPQQFHAPQSPPHPVQPSAAPGWG